MEGSDCSSGWFLATVFTGFQQFFKQRKVLQVFAAGEWDRMGLQYSEISELCRLYLAVLRISSYFYRLDLLCASQESSHDRQDHSIE